MGAKLLVIGLDGADAGLIDDYCARGIMPVLAGLRAGGRTASLTKQVPLSDDALWASFATALPLGEHGRFHGPAQPRSGEYLPQKFADRPMQHQTFWARLSRQGRSVAVLDVPKCPLSSDLNGFQVRDWLVHGRDLPTPISAPAPVMADIIARFGAAPASPCDHYDYHDGAPHHRGFTQAELAAAQAQFCASLDAKLAASAHFLREREWDLFITVFKELHCAGHLIWHAGDPEHPEYSAQFAGAAGRPLEHLYRRIDAALGQLLAEAGPDLSVAVFSPHGMEPNHTANGMIGQFVMQKGMEWNTWPARIADKLAAAAQRFAPSQPRLRMADLRRSRLFYTLAHYECASAIRINLAGREPQGIVQPGAGLAAITQRLTGELLALRFKADGSPVVAAVEDFQARYPGARSADLPDLLVTWQKHHCTGPIITGGGEEIAPPHGRLRPGGHDDHGFCILAGPITAHEGFADGPIEELAALLEGFAASQPS